MTSSPDVQNFKFECFKHVSNPGSCTCATCCNVPKSSAATKRMFGGGAAFAHFAAKAKQGTSWQHSRPTKWSQLSILRSDEIRHSNFQHSMFSFRVKHLWASLSLFFFQNSCTVARLLARNLACASCVLCFSCAMELQCTCVLLTTQWCRSLSSHTGR